MILNKKIILLFLPKVKSKIMNKFKNKNINIHNKKQKDNRFKDII